jgi:hypothetical protein
MSRYFCYEPPFLMLILPNAMSISIYWNSRRPSSLLLQWCIGLRCLYEHIIDKSKIREDLVITHHYLLHFTVIHRRYLESSPPTDVVSSNFYRYPWIFLWWRYSYHSSSESIFKLEKITCKLLLLLLLQKRIKICNSRHGSSFKNQDQDIA